MEYFARFEEKDGHLFRFDTRIYLDSLNPDAASVCIGAIVGKNPGSASPTALKKFVPIDLNGDKMLPTVGNRFIEGYRRAKKPVPSNAFVRVWNLFYVCNRDLGEALWVASKLSSLPTCPSESDSVLVVWYGWGGADADLNPYKARFLKRKYKTQFFYDHRSAKIAQNAPAFSDFAKHTQGMPAEPVVQYLAGIL